MSARRPATLILPPAPYAAALFGGWWLDHNFLPLPWDWGAATQAGQAEIEGAAADMDQPVTKRSSRW